MALKQTRTFLLAAVIAAGGVSYAMAQSSPAPANQSGGVNATPGATTDPGTAGQTGNTKGTPALKTRKNENRMTTGSGASHSGMKPAKREPAKNSTTNSMGTNSMGKTTSPASPNPASPNASPNAGTRPVQ